MEKLRGKKMVQSRFVDVDGVSTHYREVGAGHPIVLIHGGEPAGGGGGSDTWPDEFYMGLAEAGYRAIGIDRLAQGKTGDPKSADQFRMSASLKHMEGFLDALGIRGATLVGQSRGAFVAVRVAQDRPDLVSSVVIINSGSLSPTAAAEPLPGDIRHRVYTELLNGDPRNDAIVMSVTTDHITDEYVANRIAVKNSPVRSQTSRLFKQEEREFYREFETIKLETLEWIKAGNYAFPTLIVWGVGDPTTRAEDAVELFHFLRPAVNNIRLYMINRAGHAPYREYPSEVVNQIVAFLPREENQLG